MLGLSSSFGSMSTMTISDVQICADHFGDMFVNNTGALALASAGNHEGFCYLVDTLGWKINKETVDLYYQGFLKPIAKDPKDLFVKTFKENIKMLEVMATHAKRLWTAKEIDHKPAHDALQKLTDDATLEQLSQFLVSYAGSISPEDMKSLMELHGNKVPISIVAYDVAKNGNLPAYKILSTFGWVPDTDFVQSVAYYIYCASWQDRSKPGHLSLTLSSSQPILSHLIK